MRSYNEYKNADSPGEFFDAARTGDFIYFEHCLRDDKSFLNSADAKGYSVFMLACYHGHLKLAELLLSNGANPNDTDASGNTVLMGVAFKGHVEIVKLLLANGADVKQRNSSGQDALLFSRMFGRVEVTKILAPDIKPTILQRFRAWNTYLYSQLMKGTN